MRVHRPRAMKGTVVCYGGLFNSVFRWLERKLINYLTRNFSDFKFEVRTWTDVRPLPDDAVMVIGHSFGGYRAVQMAGELPLFTFDCRWWVEHQYKTESRLAFNYYQLGFMPGSRVEGAYNQQIGYLSHVNMPMCMQAHGKIKEVLSDL